VQAPGTAVQRAAIHIHFAWLARIALSGPTPPTGGVGLVLPQAEPWR